MRYYLLLFLFISSFSFAQKSGVSSNNVFHIDSLPVNGILLDKGWKWHAGDNPDFAKADFDDSKWESIDPTKDIMSLGQVKNAPLSWFRLQIEVDSAFRGKTLALLIKQTGASEIYLNGTKLHQFGKLSTKASETEGYDPQGNPISLPLSNQNAQLIAVRFATSDIFLATLINTQNHALALKISSIESTVNINHDFIRGSFSLNDQFLAIFKVGFFLILCFLHFTFYLLYKHQKSNLYFSIYALITAFASFTTLYNYIHDLTIRNGVVIATVLVVPISPFTALLAVQKLLNGEKKILFWLCCLVTAISLPLALWPYQLGNLAGGLILYILVVLTVSMMAWKSYKKGNSGALGIFIGSINFFVFYICFLIFFNASTDLPYRNILVDICFNIALLSLPLAISYYLAHEFATNRKTIEQNLLDYKKLSEEKQQLLATQNETLERQVAERTAELRASQNQLIQKEKLASLGELTAGIAHEIQNPLNFVNNFSELSTELIDEMNEEIEKGDTLEVKAIAEDLKQNLEKINHHGKRASSIVKGMLEHSRMSTGERTLTDINQLADEYLRLSYHGLRAKDSLFNSDYELITNKILPKINVVPQEIGRVLLNLINNAFYAVNERSKLKEAGYQPKVTVTTKATENQIQVHVQDNGTGISDATQAKIFQPFFTTKPTGEGTGLGLSLAYDIVTKGHGGTLEVESVEGEGTTFVVKLPILKS